MASAPQSAESVQAQVEALRKKLLDLTLRNRMLNYKPSKRLGITIIGEDSAELHRLLVDEGKRMSFVGRPDPPKLRLGQPSLTEFSDHSDPVSLAKHRQAAEEELDAFLGNPVVPLSQQDTKLNVDELESVLQAKLRTIQREAAIAEEELGINTLFLTLGALEWSENDRRTFQAPILYVPVRLERLSNGTMRLIHDGGDVGTNLPLGSKFAEFNLSLPEFSEETTVLDYFSAIESTIDRRGDWVVHRDQVCLSFFNYEKYSMYVDLGGESWPEGQKPWQNADIQAMLGGGFPSAESPITELTQLDTARPIRRSFEVYDADASQLLAMIRAGEGLSIVVEGPPGTGKSQTITNIIAEAVAMGKTVLFVSAKRAALDVVKRRLDEADLGAMCLDLHDKLTNRKAFYQEIKTTVDRKLALKEEEARLNRLEELRDRLNGHSSAINELLLDYDITPFYAMACAARLPKETPEDRPGRIGFEHLKQFKHQDIEALVPLVSAFQERIRTSGTPCDHPYYGIEMDYLDPAKRLDLSVDLDNALTAWNEMARAIDIASHALKVSPPTTVHEVEVLRRVYETAVSSPPHQGVGLKRSDWSEAEDSIRSTISLIRERNEIRKRMAPQVTDSAWTFDLTNIEETYKSYGEKWFKFAVSQYRSARQALDVLLTNSAPKDAIARHLLVLDLIRSQEIERFVDKASGSMKGLFGAQWNGIDSDTEALTTLTNWVLDLQSRVSDGELPEGILDLLTGAISSEEISTLIQQAEKLSEGAIQRYEDLCKLLVFPSDACRLENLDAVGQRIQRWHDAQGRIAEYLALNEVRRAVKGRGLHALLSIADRWPLAGERMADAFQRSYFEGILREAMQGRPELRSFERTIHESAVQEYQALDDFKLRYNRGAVRLSHCHRLPTFDMKVGNLNLLRIQCELQRKHKPIRWIMGKAGEAIQRIKPVFMMSPLSVAIHLPPELPPFDMVIFDEASQVRPEDALCAIARAKQTIVVGDTRQMPPTSFFDRLVDDEESDEDEEIDDIGSTARHLESVLSLMSAVSVGQIRRPDLRWHYRSLHPALIQPSNEMFYGNRLVVFPSAKIEENGQRIGLVFHHHPETVYEPGATKRFNRLEAELVADAIVQHIQTSPQESLLVAAMNKPQADLIYDEVQKRERLNPADFAAFRSRHPHEPLAIKNLENVQGDERDVVYVSVTYGRDCEGIIRQQFGPLLKEGGERRLNVLITRARRRCEVFSNLSAGDLRAESGRVGVESLKRYLKFAETGTIDVASVTGKAEESPFEVEVADALRELGYAFDLQVGFEGFRIDLAVIHPDHPGSYLLGIECDGATYHSARTARDRDKLRQRILESRGWKLHRIWSRDWWQDREGEIRRLIDAIEASKHDDSPVQPLETPELEHDVDIVEIPPEAWESNPLRPYTTAPTPDHELSQHELGDYMLAVVHGEGPIHEDLLRMRLRDGAGFARSGKSVNVKIDQVIAENRSRVRFTVDAYFGDESQLRQARDWSVRPSNERKVEWVPEIEIAAALRLVVGNAFGIDEPTAAKSALNLLGFKRVSETGMARGLSVVHRMISAGGLRIVEGQLYRPSKK